MLTVWLVTLLLEVTLTTLLWLLREDRHYPAFTYYISFQLAEALALQVCYHLHLGAAYFYTYWISFAVDVVLKLAVLVELFHAAFRAELVERVVVRRFYTVTAFIVGISFLIAFRFPSSYPVRLMAVIRTADTGASLALLMTLAALLIFAEWEGVYWANHARGIGLGLVLYLPLRVIIRTAGQSAGRGIIAGLNWLELFAYLGALLVWTRTFVFPEALRGKVNAEALRCRLREMQDIGKALR